MTTAAADDWVSAAMADMTLVVELLVGLHRDSPPSIKPDVSPLEWRVRQRRSKPVSATNPKKPGHRSSPTTPLSWSGATSPTGGSDDSTISPRACILSSCAGSKVDQESQKTPSKKPRKKKNLAALKEEECSLIKERRELKRKIAALSIHLNKGRTTNENLKRMKLELTPVITVTTVGSEEKISSQLQQSMAASASHPSTLTAPLNIFRESVVLKSSPDENPHPASDSKFVLPDLNIPFDEVQTSNFIC